MIKEQTVPVYEDEQKANGDQPGRPKRNITVKNLDISSGLSWREERDLKKALYASLQERRRNSNDKKFENGDGKGIGHDTSSNSSSSTPSAVGNRGGTPFRSGTSISRSGSLDDSTQDSMKTTATLVSQEPKKYFKPGTKIHAQRKFAQNVTPHTRSVATTLPTPPPAKPLKLNMLPKATKTEDFLTFLCLRGTTALPPHLDLFNKPESPEEQSTPSLPSLSSKQDLGREGTPESSSSASFSNNHEEDESETPTPNGKLTTPVGKAARACASTPQTARGLRGFKPSSMKKELRSRHALRASPYGRRSEMSPKHLSRGKYKVPPGVLTPASSDRGFATPQKFLTPRGTPRSGSSVSSSVGRKQLPVSSKQAGSKRKALFVENSDFATDKLQSYRGRQKAAKSVLDDPDIDYLYEKDAKKSKKLKVGRKEKSFYSDSGIVASSNKSKGMVKKKSSLKRDIRRKVGSNFKKIKRLQPREKPIHRMPEGTRYNENRKHLHPKKLKLRQSKRLQRKKETVGKNYKGDENDDYAEEIPSLLPSEMECSSDFKKKKRQPSFARKLTAFTKFSLKKLKGKSASKDSAKLAKIIETKRGKMLVDDSEVASQTQRENQVEKAKRRMRVRKCNTNDKTKSSADRSIKFEPFPVSNEPAKLVDIPIFYPTDEEFGDPVSYISRIQSEAEPYGMCKIEPPVSWKLESKINEEMRFPTQVQYVHRMFNRWGNNTVKLECIKKHLEASKVEMKQVPSIGGVEVDLAKLSQTVQEFEVVQNMGDKKLWTKVSDAMRIPKLAQDRSTKLYDIYCKYLLSYDTLSSDEKNKLQQQVTIELQKREKSNETEDCIVKGSSMTLAGFQRLARNTAYTWCKEEKPAPEQIESDYWKYVEDTEHHVMVQCGHVNSQTQGSGFPTKKDSPYGKHPWNLNNLSADEKSVLHHLGSSSGATVPILHIGMSYSTSCWTTDHHFLPYLQYLHTGSDDLIWYCIPANLEEKFQNALNELVPNYVRDGRKWLREDTIMVSPDLLVEKGVSVSQCIQRPRQFVVIFPRVYTASVSCGYTLSESAHFATQEWIPHGVAASEALCSNCEKEMFSMDELIMSICQAKEVSIEVLNAALPFLDNLVQKELDLRKQIFDAGLKIFRKMLPKVNGSQTPQRKRKYDAPDEEENLCEICKKKCFLSVVVNEADGDLLYCIEHAMSHVQKKKNLKTCRLMYRHDEIELKTILQTVKYKIESRISELTGRRRSSKKPETRS